jgi:hypothetical protein
MHCEDCQNLLIDLAYGELDDVRSAEVRWHLDRCSSCAADWAKIARGRTAAAMLPVARPPEPSPLLIQSIENGMAASCAERTDSRSKATSNGTESVQNATKIAEETVETLGEAEARAANGPGTTMVSLKGGARWIERLAALAMRREVAMAAVFLMALGVGVTTLYHPSRNPAITEEDRSRDVIPAVELSAEHPSTNERAAQRRATSADPSLRTRKVERADNITRGLRSTVIPTNSATSAAAAIIPSPSPAAQQAVVAGSLPSDTGDRVTSNDSVLPSPSQNATSNIAAPPEQIPSQAAPSLQRAMPNADVEVATVQPQPMSTMELAARSALARGEWNAALERFRQALAATSDDATRARLQREIASLEAMQTTATAAQNAQNSHAASVSTARVQGPQRPYRRTRVAPARAINQSRSSTENSADPSGVLGY